MKPWLKWWKNSRFYETLLQELRLEDEYNLRNYVRMTHHNFEEIFQLIIELMTKGNIKMDINIGLGESYQSYVF